MSNPWAQSFEELRSPYLQEKMAKKDYDGDGKIETGTQEYMGSRDKAIKKAMGKKVEDKKKVAEHHQKDANGNTIPHEDEGDGTPSSVEEAKIDTVDPKNKRKRRNERAFGKQTKPYDPDTKEMKTSMGKFMNSMRHKQHQSKRGRKTTGPDAGMKKEEIVLEADKKGKGSGKKDACYHKVKASASVWPSAYASGRLVQCRKKGAKNYGNSKKEDFDFTIKSFGDYVGECWKTHKQQGMKRKGGKMVPNCVPKSESYTVTNADKVGNTPAYQGLVKGKLNVKTGKPLYKAAGHLKLDKAHYDWKEDLHWEAMKRDKLDIKETGVKNKIEINPTVKTEAAKAPVKK